MVETEIKSAITLNDYCTSFHAFHMVLIPQK
jgi:hypothetical protein